MTPTRYRAATIARGAIVWLPGRRFIKTAVPDLPSDIFDHPVLIFHIEEPDIADVFPVGTPICYDRRAEQYLRRLTRLNSRR